MGSKTFPKETHFVDFISSHNGKFNGFTSLDKTAFYFKINKDFFEKALHIFSRFFIDPLFNETFVAKEINAVNSEFERNCQTDSRKKEEVLHRLSNPNSSMYNFRTGNNQTLGVFTATNNINLKQRVLEYYVKFFNPNFMKIVVSGPKTPNEYYDLLNKYMGQVIQKRPVDFGLNQESFNKD